MIEPLPGGDYRVNARMALDEVNDLLRAQLPEGDWDTIGGLLLSELGHVPAEGEAVEVAGWQLTAQRVVGPAHRPGAGAPGPRLRPRAVRRRGPLMRSGFVTFVGRPNVGKSTLLNQILRTKVAITSDKPQTTRTRIMGVLTRPDAQIVFVDTPGIHKPRTALGTRLNATAQGTIGDVDVVCFVLDATQPFGRGDQWVANLVPKDADLHRQQGRQGVQEGAGRPARGRVGARASASTSPCRPRPVTASPPSSTT